MDTRSPSDILPEGVELEYAVVYCSRVAVRARATAVESRCSLCGRPSRRVHGSYSRTVAALPRHGVPGTLRIRVRPFFCDDPSCERAIFCERLPKSAVRARKTDRPEEALLAIALELGGEAGARIAREPRQASRRVE